MGKLLAVILSFFVVGLGQFYNGQATKAIFLFFAGLVLGVLTGGVLYIPIWLFGMFDAYSNAK